MRLLDETIYATAAEYLAEANGDAEKALVFAVADNLHRGYHRKPPRSKTPWTPKPEHAPLDIAAETSPHG
jgi:hypothetical protein